MRAVSVRRFVQRANAEAVAEPLCQGGADLILAVACDLLAVGISGACTATLGRAVSRQPVTGLFPAGCWQQFGAVWKGHPAEPGPGDLPTGPCCRGGSLLETKKPVPSTLQSFGGAGLHPPPQGCAWGCQRWLWWQESASGP